MVNPASLRPVGTGFTGLTATHIINAKHVFHAGFGARVPYEGSWYKKEEERPTLRQTWYNGDSQFKRTTEERWARPRMNFEDIRRLTITALFSDDFLFEQIVLKGGNAMSLVHGISSRASLDLDFSLARDFADLQDIQARMERALANRFASVRLVPFDVKLLPKPSISGESPFPWWGGYRFEFKLVDEERLQRLRSNVEQLRREATVIGPNQLKVFSIDLSKWEYTEGKTRTDLDSYTIYVYTPAMIALEKMRAICQQIEDYAPTGRTKHPRARDFYDIHSVVTKTDFRFDSPETAELVREIFAAKKVPLSLLGKITDQREFHRTDWPSVVTTTSGKLEGFDYYFDFVLRGIEPLHALWMK